MLFNPSRPNPRLKKKLKFSFSHFVGAGAQLEGGVGGGLPCAKLEFQNLCPNFRLQV